MIIMEINKNVFDEFSNAHPLHNCFQTSNYGILMKNKYEIMYIGGYKNNSLVAASLILYKSIAPTVKYGYAPRGFIIDYNNNTLITEFTNKIKSFFLLKNFAFIKINPEVIYSVIDVENKKKLVDSKVKDLIFNMKNLGYEKLKNNLYFESMLPKYNPIINLKDFDKTKVSKKCYIKSHSIINTSLKLKKGSINDMETFYSFVKDKSNKTINYYKDLYTIFKRDNSIDLLLVEIDFYKFLDVYRNKYENMLIENDEINENFSLDPTNSELYSKKVDSDNKLSEIKHKIDLINDKLKNNIKKEIIGASLLIRSNNKISLVISGFDKEFNNLNYRYFLYYKFIEYYKKIGFLYLDLNGISGNFTEKNPYKGLNDFKLSFNPNIYEYIGEFDLVINNTYYNVLWNTGKLKKEFIN